MTKLFDLFPEVDFVQQHELGNIRIQQHPEFRELHIANYTEQAAFNRDWNPVTRTCRGLIYNANTEEVLARPFPKFFNFDEKEAPRILDDQVVYSYSNKYDGSLGIVYPTEDGLMVATRGSFASEQAKLGTKLLRELDEWHYDYLHEMLNVGYTPLFEICGPDNRIVLKYDENFLAPLGYIHIVDGHYFPHEQPSYSRTMRSLLMDLSRTNAEGWVVWKTAYEAVKIKQADYVELHRIVTNLSKKEVWRQLRAGNYNQFKLNLPDEWWDWAENIADELRANFTEILTYAQACEYGMGYVFAGLAPSRKEQAAWIMSHVETEYRGLVFSLLDGRDISDAIWRMLEPRGDE